MTGAITKNMLENLGLRDCYLANETGNPVLDSNNMLQSTDLCDLDLTKLSSLNTSGGTIDGVKLTVHIDPIDLLNTIQIIADSSSSGTSGGIEFGDEVMIKLDRSSGTCNLETNICTYPNTEILENNPSEAPDLSNAVPKNELVRLYFDNTNYHIVNVNGTNKYLYPIIFHPNNDD